MKKYSRSRKGAWIEILTVMIIMRTALSRSRKGAWIEIIESEEKGWKYESLPQGSVD